MNFTFVLLYPISGGVTSSSIDLIYSGSVHDVTRLSLRNLCWTNSL